MLNGINHQSAISECIYRIINIQAGAELCQAQDQFHLPSEAELIKKVEIIIQALLVKEL